MANKLPEQNRPRFRKDENVTVTLTGAQWEHVRLGLMTFVRESFQLGYVDEANAAIDTLNETVEQTCWQGQTPMPHYAKPEAK